MCVHLFCRRTHGWKPACQPLVHRRQELTLLCPSNGRLEISRIKHFPQPVRGLCFVALSTVVLSPPPSLPLSFPPRQDGLEQTPGQVPLLHRSRRHLAVQLGRQDPRLAAHGQAAWLWRHYLCPGIVPECPGIWGSRCRRLHDLDPRGRLGHQLCPHLRW